MTGHSTYLIDKVDIYALGITLFSIMFLDLPFGEKFDNKEFNNLYNDP